MRRTVLLVLAATIGGCGSGGYSGSDAPVHIDDSVGPWAQTICKQNFKCASKADIGGNNMNGCVTVDTMVWQSLASSVKADQAKGRVTYDEAAMGKCLSALYHETCDEWTAGLAHDPWCREAFTPMVQVGGACLSDVECIDGSCPDADLSKTPPVEGTCQAHIAAGAACTFNDKCVMGQGCTNGMCAPVKAGGTACGSDDECASGHCNPDTSLCSGYQGCAVAPTTREALLSVLAFGLLVATAGRRRRPAP
jgi:hypothetical protein